MSDYDGFIGWMVLAWTFVIGWRLYRWYRAENGDIPNIGVTMNLFAPRSSRGTLIVYTEMRNVPIILLPAPRPAAREPLERIVELEQRLLVAERDGQQLGQARTDPRGIVEFRSTCG